MRTLLVLLVAIFAASTPAATANATITRHVRVGDDLRFHPRKLRIHAGTRVVWRWGGMLLHNVTVIRGPVRFHSRTKLRGTYKHRFRSKGVYRLEDTVHRFKMTVRVS